MGGLTQGLVTGHPVIEDSIMADTGVPVLAGSGAEVISVEAVIIAIVDARDCGPLSLFGGPAGGYPNSFHLEELCAGGEYLQRNS